MFPLNHLDHVVFTDLYTYRTALPGNIIWKYNRDDMRALEDLLCEQAGVIPDNHTMYRFEVKGKGYYAWFSDLTCIITRSIRHINW